MKSFSEARSINLLQLSLFGHAYGKKKSKMSASEVDLQAVRRVANSDVEVVQYRW